MSKIDSYRSYQAGYTFHELLVAMSLTAVAVLGYSLSTIGAKAMITTHTFVSGNWNG